MVSIFAVVGVKFTKDLFIKARKMSRIDIKLYSGEKEWCLGEGKKT